MNIGDTVNWSSQSGGIATTKSGTLIGFIEKNKSGYQALSDATGIPIKEYPKSIMKFQDFNMVYRRALVKVPRGGRSVLHDFYAPSENIIESV